MNSGKIEKWNDNFLFRDGGPWTKKIGLMYLLYIYNNPTPRSGLEQSENEKILFRDGGLFCWSCCTYKKLLVPVLYLKLYNKGPF